MDNREEFPVSPRMPLTEALTLACRKSGRQLAEACSADYSSDRQVRTLLAMHGAVGGRKRMDAHWRIQFAVKELIVQELDGPECMYSVEPVDDILVFEDGVAMTFAEWDGTSPPGDSATGPATA